MKYNFEKKLKKFEQELLDLKTASRYVSIKNSYMTSSQSVTTGVYEITYAPSDEPIISMAYKGILDKTGYFYLRTPSINSQIVDVLTTYWSNADQTYYTDTNTIVIVSNRPVVSIVRL